MKTTLLALIATFAVGLSIAAANAPVGSRNSSATGDYVRSNGTHIVFNAVLHKDGTVSGSLYSEQTNGFVFHVEYDQLFFSGDGKTAYLHGVVTYANSNPLLVGRHSIQKVTDNGEGANEPADAVGPIFNQPSVPSNALPGSIAFLDGFATSGIIDGNIQVRP
jgi:hypothetical protein